MARRAREIKPSKRRTAAPAFAQGMNRVDEAVVLTALVAGWRGSFLGEKPTSIVDDAIRMSREWAVAQLCTLGH